MKKVDRFGYKLTLYSVGGARRKMFVFSGEPCISNQTDNRAYASFMQVEMQKAPAQLQS